MIETEPQLRQAIEQMENLWQAINSLRAEVFPQNPRSFAVLAEGPLEQIRQFVAKFSTFSIPMESLYVIFVIEFLYFSGAVGRPRIAMTEC